MFTITNGKGFQIKFANGWTVSVQFGTGNYCENRDFTTGTGQRFPGTTDGYERREYTAGAMGCQTAEIAAWDSNDVWYAFEHDTVKGWCSADDVAAFIAEIAAK
jgi:hypothetical protein